MSRQVELDRVFYQVNALREAGDLPAIQALYATGDAEIQQSVLNALWGEPGSNPEMGPGIVALAVQGSAHPSAGVRTEACFVIQNQSAWRVDVTLALEPLLKLLQDPHPNVRRMAAFATGNVSRRKYDLSPHLPALIRLLRDEDRYVREAAPWALAQLSRAKYDLAPALPNLFWLLMLEDDFDAPRKNAVGALLHHARKSPENAALVKQLCQEAVLNPELKFIQRFLDQLQSLT